MYLSEELAEALRRKSIATGRSRSELIREGVARVTNDAPKRVFHSMGVGDSGGRKVPLRWDPDELYEDVMGERPSQRIDPDR